MLYRALRRGLESKPFLISHLSSLTNYIDSKVDWYESLYFYNEEHKKRFGETNTLAGIRDTVTNHLYFDFDSTTEIDDTFYDAAELISRLQLKGIPDDSIGVYFTGNKGVAVKVQLDSYITPQEFKSAVYELASDLKTFDKVVNDPNRVIRIVNTRHQKSGLFKVQLSLEELESLSKEEILELAKQPRDVTGLTPTKMFVVEKKQEEAKKENKGNKLKDLTFDNKPKWLTNCKWSLQNGFFSNGMRNNVFLALASTYKSQGFDLEVTYRMLKGVATLQAKRNNEERYNDDELYNNIVLQVFGEWWQGGTYSCKTDGWLKDYCTNLGEHSCKKSNLSNEPKRFGELSTNFKTYAKNIDKNTILTGIPSIDNNVFLSTGVNLGILGAAGSGKSALALEILSNTSKAGVKSVFASLDMHGTRMYEKAMYRVTGLKREELYKIYQNDTEQEIVNKFNKEFENVFFFNKSCPTVQDIKEYILQCEEQSGEKIKLVMVDYFERVSSDFSDDTQASKRVAGELQDLVNELDIALITIVQPNKFGISSGPDSPLYSYNSIKGSSFVYQAFRVILSLWRPFYNPRDFSEDKYIQMAVLKNDLGELNEFVFKWNGKRGLISEMEDFEKDNFYDLLAQKKDKKDHDNGWE